LYSASLANSRSRGRVFMGNEASMEVGNQLKVYANHDSQLYKGKIKNGIIQPNIPILQFPKTKNELDGISSASEKYYAERGLIDTLIEGKKIDLAHLHLKEWIDVIRDGGTTSCNIDRAFQDTVSVLMVHKSYVEQRRVEWDPIKKRII